MYADLGWLVVLVDLWLVKMCYYFKVRFFQFVNYMKSTHVLLTIVVFFLTIFFSIAIYENKYNKPCKYGTSKVLVKATLRENTLIWKAHQTHYFSGYS